MWSMTFIIVIYILSFSLSPYTALSMLIILSLVLGVLTGIYHSLWFFFTLMVFYLGGVMVMFTYLTALMSSQKILTQKLSAKESLLIFLIAFFMVANEGEVLLDYSIQLVEGGYYCSEFVIIMSLVVLLLATLIITIKLLQQTEGPMSN